MVWGIWLLLLGVFVAMLPMYSRAGPAAWRAQCANRLKNIMLAMENYHDVYGSFPPAYTVDKEGRPLHSWRALLLPFVEENALYDRLRLDELWDSPHNRAVFDSAELEGRSPSCYHCAADKENRVETNYMMIVGPKTISNGPGCVRLKDITDDKATTICVVEVTGSGIRWYEPGDLDAEQMSYRINDPGVGGIRSRHRGGAQVAMCDGSVRFLPDSTDRELVKGASTINGREDVSGAFTEK